MEGFDTFRITATHVSIFDFTPYRGISRKWTHDVINTRMPMIGVSFSDMERHRQRYNILYHHNFGDIKVDITNVLSIEKNFQGCMIVIVSRTQNVLEQHSLSGLTGINR